MADKNSMRSMMQTTYGDNKASKSKELNESMTIKSSSSDEYTKKIMNMGGSK